MARSSQYPPSVDPGPPVEPPTPVGWSRRTFGELLEVVERPVELDDGREYQLVNAKRSRGGITPRDRLKGADIRVKSQFRVESGDFLVSKRQIIHGACGVVPRELDGAIVSNEYAVLRPRRDLDLDYLRCLSFTPYFQRTCFHSSVGVDVEKMVFKLEQWFRYAVSIPSMADQRRIAAIIALADDATTKATEVVTQAETTLGALLAESLTRGLPGTHGTFKQTPVGEIPSPWACVPLGSALSRIDAGWSPQCDPFPAKEGEWGVLKISSVTWGKFQPAENKRLPAGVEPRVDAEVKNGDLLVSRANTRELVGRAVLVENCPARLMASDKLLRLRLSEETAVPEFLVWVFASATLREQICDAATGSSGSMKNISQEKLRSLLVPLPPVPEQRQIARCLAEMRRCVEAEVAALDAIRALRQAALAGLLSGRLQAATAGVAA